MSKQKITKIRNMESELHQLKDWIKDLENVLWTRDGVARNIDYEDAGGISADAHLYEGYKLIVSRARNLELKIEEIGAAALMGVESECKI